jgi:uncharacterized protein YbjT (DUF2867 family)
MKVLLTGASGFVGGEILDQLLRAGHSIRVISRSEKASRSFPPNVEIFHGNIIHGPSIAGCMEGIEAVIHIVGVITEVEENTYDRVHRIGTQNLLAETKKAKVKRFIHMSALGTRANARSRYHQSKWAAEELVRNSGLDFTIFKPSIIYGRRDAFVNLFAKMMSMPWNLLKFFSLPLFGGGRSHMQPISVSEVAHCFVSALEKPESVKKTYELCGPRALQFREVLATIAEVKEREAKEIRIPLHRYFGDWGVIFLPFAILPGLFIQPTVLLVHIPWQFGSFIAWCMECLLTKPPLNRDQILMLEEDNVGDASEAIKDFGMQPSEFKNGIATYLSH